MPPSASSTYRFLRHTDGNVAVEVAMAAPILILLLLGLLDHGLLMRRAIALEAAARAGVEAVSANPGPTGIAAALQAATSVAGNGVVVDSPALRCVCASGQTASCTTLTCPGTNIPIRVFITVSTRQSLRPMIDWPWLASPVVLTGQATMRVQ